MGDTSINFRRVAQMHLPFFQVVFQQADEKWGVQRG
jgi:hypothetical protein